MPGVVLDGRLLPSPGRRAFVVAFAGALALSASPLASLAPCARTSCPSPTPPVSGRRSARSRVPGLLAEGKLDRTVRVLARADEDCPRDRAAPHAVCARGDAPGAPGAGTRRRGARRRESRATRRRRRRLAREPRPCAIGRSRSGRTRRIRIPEGLYRPRPRREGALRCGRSPAALRSGTRRSPSARRRSRAERCLRCRSTRRTVSRREVRLPVPRHARMRVRHVFVGRPRARARRHRRSSALPRRSPIPPDGRLFLRRRTGSGSSSSTPAHLAASGSRLEGYSTGVRPRARLRAPTERRSSPELTIEPHGAGTSPRARSSRA